MFFSAECVLIGCGVLGEPAIGCGVFESGLNTRMKESPVEM